jgi:ABC-type iron transport system FetAB permease component
MINFFAGIAATFVTVPVLGFILVYLISRFIMKNNRKSFFLSVDITTVFFLIAVHYLLLVIVGKSMLWLIFLILVFSILLTGFVTWRKSHEIDMVKVLKKSWRFVFLASTFAYFLLLLIGLVQRIFVTTIN